MSDLTYVSLNVKGINNVIKRKKFLTWFKKEKTNIALLQETHLSDVEHLKLKREWVGQVYFSSFSSSKRGVAILIHKNTPFVLTKCIKDDQGRFVIIIGRLYGESVLIGCIYAPNVYLENFYSELIKETSVNLTIFTVLAGDFNCSIGPEMDQNPPPNNSVSKKREAIKSKHKDCVLTCS